MPSGSVETFIIGILPSGTLSAQVVFEALDAFRQRRLRTFCGKCKVSRFRNGNEIGRVFEIDA